MLLKDKVAIVTGGTGGIGAAIVKKFVKEDCYVVFTYNKNKDIAAKIQTETQDRAMGYQLDVRNFSKIKDFVRKIKETVGGLDILVNNAGIVQDKALVMMEKSNWDKVIDTNLTGAFNTTRACIFTFMRQKSGNIINIASLSGVLGIAGQTNYAASKAGLIGFTKALAKETGPYNIRVNAIAPGFIRTDMTARVKGLVKDKIIGQVALRRFGTPDEVAELALFLATDRSNYITGQTLVIDGGLT